MPEFEPSDWSSATSTGLCRETETALASTLTPLSPPEATARLIRLARALAHANREGTEQATDELAASLAHEFCSGRECALRDALNQLEERSRHAKLDHLQDRAAFDLLLSGADDFACRAQCPDCEGRERRRPMRVAYALPLMLRGAFGYRLDDAARDALAAALRAESFDAQSSLALLPGLVPARTLAGLRWLPMLHLILAFAEGGMVFDRIPGSGSDSQAISPWQLRFLLMVLEQPAGSPETPPPRAALDALRTRLEPLLQDHLGVEVELLDIPRTAFVALQSGVVAWLLRSVAERRDRLIAGGRSPNHLHARSTNALPPERGLRVEILDDEGISLADTLYPTDGIEQAEELLGLVRAGSRTLGLRLDPDQARASSAATAGRTRPSKNSRNAPPPVEM